MSRLTMLIFVCLLTFATSGWGASIELPQYRGSYSLDIETWQFEMWNYEVEPKSEYNLEEAYLNNSNMWFSGFDQVYKIEEE